jgi:ankyrin repeat protein
VEYLCLRGADINKKDMMENTPLMHSVKNWNIEVIKLILEKLNGDLTIRDKNNLTVLE